MSHLETTTHSGPHFTSIGANSFEVKSRWHSALHSPLLWSLYSSPSFPSRIFSPKWHIMCRVGCRIQLTQLESCPASNWLIKQGLTSHQTHYRSYRGRVFNGSNDPTNSVKALKEQTPGFADNCIMQNTYVHQFTEVPLGVPGFEHNSSWPPSRAASVRNLNYKFMFHKRWHLATYTFCTVSWQYNADYRCQLRASRWYLDSNKCTGEVWSW